MEQHDTERLRLIGLGSYRSQALGSFDILMGSNSCWTRDSQHPEPFSSGDQVLEFHKFVVSLGPRKSESKRTRGRIILLLGQTTQLSYELTCRQLNKGRSTQSQAEFRDDKQSHADPFTANLSLSNNADPKLLP